MASKKFDIALILSAVDRASTVVNRMANNATARLSKLSAKASALSDASFKNGQQLVAGGLAIGIPIYKAIQAASEFETKMVDIRKQISELDDPKVMATFRKEIFSLSGQLPIATSEIQELIAAGARMGIAKKDLVEYTKEVTKMSVAFDIAAAQVGEDMGKIAKVFNIPIDKIKTMADAINYLDDNAISKGADIIDVLLRIGQASKYMKPEEASALASTMLTLGESGETSASGINKLITVMGAASAQSKKNRLGFAMLGLDANKVQRNFTDNAQSTIIDVFKRINKLPKVDQATALNRLFGLEQGPKLTKLVSGIGEYERQLKLVQGAQKGSMDKEYAKRIETTAAQWQIMKNQAGNLAVELGNALLPSIKDMFKQLKPMVDKVAQFISKHPALITFLMKTAAKAAILKLSLGYLSFAFGGMFKTVAMGAKFFGVGVKGVSQFTKVVMGMKKMFLTLKLAAQFNQFAGMAGPLTKLGRIFKLVFGGLFKSILSFGKLLMANPIILIIAAIAVAVYLIIKHWDKIKAFFIKLWGNIKKVFKATWDFLKRMFLNYTPYGLIIKHWSKITAWFSELWEKVKAVFSNWMSWLLGIGPRMLEAGKGFITNLWNGIKQKAQWLVDKVKAIAQKVRDLWPFSPAKTGPLRDIHKIKLMETIAATVKPHPMMNAMRNVQQTVNGGFGGGLVSPVPVRSGDSLVFAPVINLSGGASSKDADMINKELEKQFNAFLREKERNATRRKF